MFKKYLQLGAESPKRAADHSTSKILHHAVEILTTVQAIPLALDSNPRKAVLKTKIKHPFDSNLLLLRCRYRRDCRWFGLVANRGQFLSNSSPYFVDDRCPLPRNLSENWKSSVKTRPSLTNWLSSQIRWQKCVNLRCRKNREQHGFVTWLYFWQRFPIGSRSNRAPCLKQKLQSTNKHHAFCYFWTHEWDCEGN